MPLLISDFIHFVVLSATQMLLIGDIFIFIVMLPLINS